MSGSESESLIWVLLLPFFPAPFLEALQDRPFCVGDFVPRVLVPIGTAVIGFVGGWFRVCVCALGEDPFRGLLEVKALCNGGASGEWSRPSRESDDQQVVDMEARGSFPEIAVAKDKKTERLTKDEKSVLAGVEESGREWYRE